MGAALEVGVVNFEGLFAALTGVGYDGWLVREGFSAVRPSAEMLRHNFELLSGLIGEDRGAGWC